MTEFGHFDSDLFPQFRKIRKFEEVENLKIQKFSTMMNHLNFELSKAGFNRILEHLKMMFRRGQITNYVSYDKPSSTLMK